MSPTTSCTWVEVTRRLRFAAAHHLPAYDGNCANVHGHNFDAWVTVAGPVKDQGADAGMVLDMGALARWWKANLEPLLDHHDLNVALPADYQPPSTEHLAVYLGDQFRAAGFNVVRVEVQETENQTASARWPSLVTAPEPQQALA